MRQVFALVSAPILAVTVFGLILAFPSPRDFVASIQPPQQQIQVVNTGGPREEAVITNLSDGRTGTHSAVALNNSDCFADLALADKAKLDRCAEVVYQALIDVERAAQPGLVQNTMTAGGVRVVEQLRYAAANVCRSRWATSPKDFSFDANPACKIAQIQVASSID